MDILVYSKVLDNHYPMATLKKLVEHELKGVSTLEVWGIRD